MKTTTDYFDVLYQQNDDPWNYENLWYEERKRNICLSLLLKPLYTSVLEIGCSNGVFSRQLALRCKQLTCVDANEKAVDLARLKLADMTHVEVLQLKIPQHFPAESYDLIVLGEVLYYLNYEELMLLIDELQQYLSEDGTILCCHWRHPIDQFSLNGDVVHEVFKENLNLYHYLSLTDPDFNIDLWTRENQSLADREGLL